MNVGWILTSKCGTNASASGSHLLAPPVMTSCVMLQVVYLNIYDYAFAYWCIYMCGITILNCGLMQIGWFDTNEQI